MKNNLVLTLLVIVVIFIFLHSCEPGHAPLPRAYFRIDLPEKEYRVFDSVFPYRFSYPVYAQVIPDRRAGAEPWWADIYFPAFKASVHMSYKKVSSRESLNGFIEDGRNFVNRHIPKASGFAERLFENPDNKVYGIVYIIKGKEAATPIQFFVTDSVNHFLRGSLYFNVTPNNDSLAPVIDFITRDIEVLIESLQWE